MTRNLYLSVVVLALWTSGCSRQQDPPGQNTPVQEASLRLAWIPSGSYAGEVVGMKRFASEHGLTLTVEPGGLGLNPITLVQTGENTCGTAAAEEVLAANDKGADLAIVGVINQDAPVGFVSLTRSNIATPKDFEGRKVGLLPFGSTGLVYQSMLRANNVDRSKILEVNVSPDLRPFLNGSYDVQPVFVYDETVTLDQQGVQYSLVDPTSFGVEDFIGQVYFCKRSTVQSNPEVVRSLVETMADGWNHALANPDEAIRMLKEFAPEIDVERERRVLAKGAKYFQGYNGQPVNSDTASWNDMVEQLRDLGLLNNSVDLKRVLALSFIQEYYARRPRQASAGS